MKKVLLACCICTIFLILSCSNKPTVPPVVTTPTYKAPVVASTFAKGADISWVTQMESSGVKFYDKTGKQQELFALMKSLGMNSIRLRAWVNPTDGWCNTADVVAKALRAKAAGMKILIDFHYSDSWADPGKQPKPAAWVTLDFQTLVTTLHDYTVSVMNTLQTNGITPDWVQVGNEVSDGMLWEDGRASTHMANFAALVKAGYTAVKSVSSTTKVIVHLPNGFDNSLYEYLFDGLKNNGAQWDIIGMSLYPTTTNYTTLDAQCLANINDMVSRYGTPAMVVEVGMDATNPTASRAFLTDLITKVNGVSNGNGLGVFYWEPEAYNWQNYGLGAFDSTGKPTIALDAFGN
ncbi:MAG: arabinogalactan endo-beta-1,4-galactanase [Sphingobacteriales bacterium]